MRRWLGLKWVQICIGTCKGGIKNFVPQRLRMPGAYQRGPISGTGIGYRRHFVTYCWTDHVRNEEVLLRVNEQRNILHVIRKRKANWIGHILRRNCLLREVIKGKIKGTVDKLMWYCTSIGTIPTEGSHDSNVTVSCICTTTYGMHVCVQMIVLCWCSFVNGCHQHDVGELQLQNSLWT